MYPKVGELFVKMTHQIAVSFLKKQLRHIQGQSSSLISGQGWKRSNFDLQQKYSIYTSKWSYWRNVLKKSHLRWVMFNRGQKNFMVVKKGQISICIKIRQKYLQIKLLTSTLPKTYFGGQSRSPKVKSLWKGQILICIKIRQEILTKDTYK